MVLFSVKFNRRTYYFNKLISPLIMFASLWFVNIFYDVLTIINLITILVILILFCIVNISRSSRILLKLEQKDESIYVSFFSGLFGFDQTEVKLSQFRFEIRVRRYGQSATKKYIDIYRENEFICMMEYSESIFEKLKRL